MLYFFSSSGYKSFEPVATDNARHNVVAYSKNLHSKANFGRSRSLSEDILRSEALYKESEKYSTGVTDTNFGLRCSGLFVECSESLNSPPEFFTNLQIVNSYVWPWNALVFREKQFITAGVLISTDWVLVSNAEAWSTVE